MVNNGCSTDERISQMIRIVSGSSSLSGTKTFLQMEIIFISVKFLYKRGNLYSTFRP